MSLNTFDTLTTKTRLRSTTVHSDEMASADLICLSHLRWNFVYQRPQHLLSRAARDRRVWFVEEPIYGDRGEPAMHIERAQPNLVVATPHLPTGLSPTAAENQQRVLLDRLIADEGIEDFVLWYYTPMALGFSRHLEPLTVVYDCMDELSHFKGAPPEMSRREAELFTRAGVVFTGGHSLFEAKRSCHFNIHPIPSSVDKTHFAAARQSLPQPPDQARIPKPRIGFFGVVDERFHIELIDQAARLRPDYQFVILGPVVKIDPATLPRHPNIHYLGAKSYQELPAYLSGWQVAMLPFALNEATRFISPTKTPEYLAAGKPVVSTSIRDVVTPYRDLGLVRIADTADDFVKAIDAALAMKDEQQWRKAVDTFLSRLSWDATWERMSSLLEGSARRVRLCSEAQ